MLVLSRKAQEVIQIGDRISITILRVKGRTVRVGIDAPADLHVRRGELPPKPVVNRQVERSSQARPASGPLRSFIEADGDHSEQTGGPAATFQRRFENWPLTQRQRLELIALATDA